MSQKENLVDLTLLIDDDRQLIRLSKRSSWTILTPDPDVLSLRIFETEKEYIISGSEKRLAIESLKDKEFDNVFDINKIGARLMLSQTGLVPTILKNVFSIPFQCKLTLNPKDSLEQNLLSCEIRIRPIKTSPSQLLEYLLNKYSEKLKRAEHITVLISGGWDSRMELALIEESRRQHQQITCVHLMYDKDEALIAYNMAKSINAEFILIDPNHESCYGYSLSKVLDSARFESNWRPTIAIYASLIDGILKKYPKSMVFGYYAWPLKGRDYSFKPSLNAPFKGRARVVTLDNDLKEKYFSNSYNKDKSIEGQCFVWSTLLNPVKDFDIYAKRDWVNWASAYGHSYAHRTRSLMKGGLNSNSCFASSDVLSRFMGLSLDEKKDESFIDFSLKKIGKEMAKIPIKSSTGSLSLKGNLSHMKLPNITYLNNSEYFSDGVKLKEKDNLYNYIKGQISLNNESEIINSLYKFAKNESFSKKINALQIIDFLQSIK